MAKDYLSTYLNDHLSGAVAALELLDRLINEVGDHGPLRQIREDIQADRQELKTLMSRLKISESPLRKAGGWIAEQFVETKLAFDDENAGPLRTLERLEALGLGINGKLALWRGLKASSLQDARLSGLDYEQLIQRAEDQHHRVEALRIDAAISALSTAA
jgi:hypothetical protein